MKAAKVVTFSDRSWIIDHFRVRLISKMFQFLFFFFLFFYRGILIV